MEGRPQRSVITASKHAGETRKRAETLKGTDAVRIDTADPTGRWRISVNGGTQFAAS